MCQIIKGVVNTMKYEEEKHPLFNQEALDQYVEDTSQYYTENMKNAMHLWGPKRLREICIDKDYKFP